ncbi:MAG: ADP-ribosylglycohydrolase family protein, partial [candidate division NC10 bacterium]
MGLACEGLSKRRQRRLFPEITGPSLFLQRGMVSDDTEHACMVAQALIASAGEVDAFTRSLARQLRVWLALLPAGVGFATLRAVVKLWLGCAPTRSGVFSAGNGPAMRSPLLGVCFGHDAQRLGDLVRASTRLTHTDPKAEYGALAAALAASMASRAPGARVTGTEYIRELRRLLPADARELLELVARAVESVAERRSTEAFAEAIGGGRGVSGYIYQTVPVVVHAWLAHQGDYRAAITAAVRCGGDTDTVAATLG